MVEAQREAYQTSSERLPQTSWEVIVVGAGPSGSTAAAALAREGCNVLLIDKEPRGRDKVCGDAIPPEATRVLFDLGARERILDSNLYRAQHFALISPSGHRVNSEIPIGDDGSGAFVVPRVKFDALVLNHAIDLGARFHQANVLELMQEGDQVTGVVIKDAWGRQEIRARVVIGADGATSKVAQTLRTDGGHRKDHKAVALRTYVQDIAHTPHEVEFFYLREIEPGYVWIFANGDGTANVGLGMRADLLMGGAKGLEDKLSQFLESPEIKKRLGQHFSRDKSRTWQLPFGSQWMQRAYGGAVLVGDAGGLIDPITGGGIKNGIISGVLAAETIVEALRDGKDSEHPLTYQQLAGYDQLIDAEMHFKMQKAYLLQLGLLHFSGITDAVMRIAGQQIANEISKTL